jgi:hypothetical protein
MNVLAMNTGLVKTKPGAVFGIGIMAAHHYFTPAGIVAEGFPYRM